MRDWILSVFTAGRSMGVTQIKGVIGLGAIKHWSTQSQNKSPTAVPQWHTIYTIHLEILSNLYNCIPLKQWIAFTNHVTDTSAAVWLHWSRHCHEFCLPNAMYSGICRFGNDWDIWNSGEQYWRILYATNTLYRHRHTHNVTTHAYCAHTHACTLGTCLQLR